MDSKLKFVPKMTNQNLEYNSVLSILRMRNAPSLNDNKEFLKIRREINWLK